jgi:hypothetical protein
LVVDKGKNEKVKKNIPIKYRFAAALMLGSNTSGHLKSGSVIIIACTFKQPIQRLNQILQF